MSGGGRLFGGEGGEPVVVDVLEAWLSFGVGRSRSTVHPHPDRSAGQGWRVAATSAPSPGSPPASWPGSCGQGVAESVLEGRGCVLLCRMWTLVGWCRYWSPVDGLPRYQWWGAGRPGPGSAAAPLSPVTRMALSRQPGPRSAPPQARSWAPRPQLGTVRQSPATKMSFLWSPRISTTRITSGEVTPPPHLQYPNDGSPRPATPRQLLPNEVHHHDE